MLERVQADTSGVIHRLLVLAALSCSGLLLASFVMFVHDQAASGSLHQQSELVGSTTAAVPAPVHHSQPRRFIDGAANELISPFKGFIHSSNSWATRGVPIVIGLLVYGLGLGFLARYSRGLS
jgi:hypothetical protein